MISLVCVADATIQVSTEDVATLVREGGENGMVVALVIVIVLAMVSFFAYVCASKWLEGKKHNRQIVDLLSETQNERLNLVKSQFELKDSISDLSTSIGNSFGKLNDSLTDIGVKVHDHERRISDIEEELGESK